MSSQGSFLYFARGLPGGDTACRLSARMVMDTGENKPPYRKRMGTISSTTGWEFPFGAATAKSRSGELPDSQLRQILPLASCYHIC